MLADLRLSCFSALARRHIATPRRRVLLHALRQMLAEVRACGFAGDVCIGGSFVTRKREPSDIDVALDLTHTGDDVALRMSALVGERAEHWQSVGLDVWLADDHLPKSDVRRLWRRAGPLVVVAAR